MFIVVLLEKWESPGVAAIALAVCFARAFLPTFANSVVESVRKQNRGFCADFFSGGIPSDDGWVLPKNLMGYRIVSACMTACRYGGKKKTAYRALKK